MFRRLYYVAFLAVIIINDYTAAEDYYETMRKTCTNECSLTEEEFRKFGPKEEKDPSEPFLCFHKCRFREAGIFDNDGTIVIDKVMKMSGNIAITEEQREKLKECIENLPKIKSNDDMRLFVKCMVDNSPVKKA